MSLYSWRGEAFDSPISTISPKSRISIVADVQYERCFQNYDYKISHVQMYKLDGDGKETGRSMVIPYDFIEEIFEITPEELSEFMEKEFREDRLVNCSLEPGNENEVIT